MGAPDKYRTKCYRSAELLSYDHTAIADALAEGVLIEVSDDDNQAIP